MKCHCCGDIKSKMSIFGAFHRKNDRPPDFLSDFPQQICHRVSFLSLHRECFNSLRPCCHGRRYCGQTTNAVWAFVPCDIRLRSSDFASCSFEYFELNLIFWKFLDFSWHWPSGVQGYFDHCEYVFLPPFNILKKLTMSEFGIFNTPSAMWSDNYFISLCYTVLQYWTQIH